VLLLHTAIAIRRAPASWIYGPVTGRFIVLWFAGILNLHWINMQTDIGFC
jgi:hypothetical protein